MYASCTLSWTYKFPYKHGEFSFILCQKSKIAHHVYYTTRVQNNPLPYYSKVEFKAFINEKYNIYSIFDIIYQMTGNNG